MKGRSGINNRCKAICKNGRKCVRSIAFRGCSYCMAHYRKNK